MSDPAERGSSDADVFDDVCDDVSDEVSAGGGSAPVGSSSDAPLPTTPPIPPPIAPPAAPPTQQPEIRWRDTSTWPGVVGIVSILLGSLGVLGALMAVGFGLSSAGADGLGLTTWNTATGVVSGALAVLLIVAGSSIVARRARGRRLARVYAVLKILLAFAGIVVALASPGAGGLVGFGGSGAVFGAMMILLGLIFTCGWPVFLLVWFARGPVRLQVDAWS